MPLHYPGTTTATTIGARRSRQQQHWYWHWKHWQQQQQAAGSRQQGEGVEEGVLKEQRAARRADGCT
jgi:hypothetical protein